MQFTFSVLLLILIASAEKFSDPSGLFRNERFKQFTESKILLLSRVDMHTLTEDHTYKPFDAGVRETDNRQNSLTATNASRFRNTISR